MILLIDGHRDTCRVTELLLNADGFVVECARDGPTGLALMARTLPACVVVDAMSTDPPGLDVLRSILGADGDVPVVVYSDARDPFIEKAAIALGASGWVQKMDSTQLIVAIRKAIGHLGGRPA